LIPFRYASAIIVNMTITQGSQATVSAQVLEDAYRHCLRLTRGHYENFPVASRLLPRRLQRPIAVIYAFARSADDFADEGDLSAEARLAKLDDYVAILDALREHRPAGDPVFIALGDVIDRHALPLEPFYDLLAAFRQDVTKHRYADFAEVLAYCRCSANPVGRLVLYLFNEATAENLRDADAVCTALQLINFWQDLAQDYDENNRIYLPQDEMAACNVTEAHLAAHRSDGALRNLLDLQIERARRLLLSGAALGTRLKGRLGLEIRATVCGGLCVLDALARRDDLFARPRLRRSDWLRILGRALFP
jgi:squalene synthase HpnC